MAYGFFRWWDGINGLIGFNWINGLHHRALRRCSSICFWAPALPAASLRAETIFWGAAEATEGHSVDVGAGVVGLGIPENFNGGDARKNQSINGHGGMYKSSYHIIIGMWCADITNTLQQDGVFDWVCTKKVGKHKNQENHQIQLYWGSGVGSLNPCQMEARISLKMWDGPSVV